MPLEVVSTVPRRIVQSMVVVAVLLYAARGVCWDCGVGMPCCGKAQKVCGTGGSRAQYAPGRAPGGMPLGRCLPRTTSVRGGHNSPNLVLRNVVNVAVAWRRISKPMSA